MNERAEPESGSSRAAGAAPTPLTPRQQGHQDAYDRTRAEVRQLYVAAQGQQEIALKTRKTRDLDAALVRLVEGADQLCADAETMPARMDEEAQERSRLLVRACAVADVVLAGVLVARMVFGDLSRGWSLGVIFMVAAGAGLLMAHVEPPGSAHKAQRIAALFSPALGAAGVLLLVLTSWWWIAPLALFGLAWVAAIAAGGLEAGTSHLPGSTAQTGVRR